MNRTEYADLVERIDDIWGTTRQWDRADRLYDLFEPLSEILIEPAIIRLVDEGRQTAPSPSKVRATMKAIANEGGYDTDKVGTRMHDHNGPLAHRCPHEIYVGTDTGPGETSCPICLKEFACHCDLCQHCPVYSRTPGDHDLPEDTRRQQVRRHYWAAIREGIHPGRVEETSPA